MCLFDHTLGLKWVLPPWKPFFLCSLISFYSDDASNTGIAV